MDEIKARKVIAVEGKDEAQFIAALLKYMKIVLSDIEIVDVAGKDNFKRRLPALVRRTGFREVKIFAVVRDADDSPKSAFTSIKTCLEKNGLKAPDKTGEFSHGPPCVGIIILPGNSDEGMLEDLCLGTVRKHEAMKCVTAFGKCIKTLNPAPKIMAKAKAQAFLAAMPKIVKSVGEGAQKGYWNFNSKSKWLSELKVFLEFFR